ncbi:MAG: DegV family protein [Clostridia bacterium]|nr:DegV family protein [Clostridia bacterium]
MNDYLLSCCLAVDLSKEVIEEKNLRYLPFNYYVDGVEYENNLNDIDELDRFYNKMKEGAITKTSLINSEKYYAYFEKLLQEGKDVVHVTLSTGLSGTYSSAAVARDLLKEKYPNQTIYLVDSLAASSGYGLLMYHLANYRDQGYTAEQLVAKAEEIKLHVNHDFIATDLTYLVRGGRVSKTAGAVGSVLKICPVMHTNKEGKLVPVKKALGKKRAIEEMVNRFLSHADGGANYNQDCFISNADSFAEALTLKEMLTKVCPNIKIKIFSIGTTIGSHCGPGTLAVFFMGKNRNEM